jgi:Fe(3+) dicitrate transport protein
MKLHKLASMFASTSIALSAFADDHGGDEPNYLSPFNVIGTKADVTELVGSGTVLNSDDLDPFFHTDVTEILRQVPGVYVRPEEGYGLFPNISIRGTDPNRSQKVTILEDGIPASPSPFSGPAAYYSPTAGRMAGFEILKGSSQLKYGPNNSGGVINYISTPIPQEQTSKIRASYGDFNTKIAHAYSGGTVDFAGGKLGYLLEVFDHRTDGWKTVSDDVVTNGYNATKGYGAYKGGDAPVYKNDMLFKLGYEFGEGNYIEFKAGRTDLDGDVSYVGLTKADFEANPYQRYAATVLDNMDSDQTRYYLRYLKEISETTKFSAAIFSNEFNRDWYKLAKVDGNSIGKGALGTAKNVAILKGDDDGTIRYKHNDRKYETKGVQANLDFEIGNNSFDLGFRYTDDKYTYKPNYTEDDYTMSTDSGLSLNQVKVGHKWDETYRDSEAIEVYLIDEIDFGNLTLTPGIRYTDVDFNRHGPVDPADGGGYKNDETTVSDTLLGIGSTYDLGSNIVYAGLHQGHALPGPGSDYEEEKSLGFEIGIRSKGNSNFYYDVAFFNTSFEDMLIYPSVGSGTEGTQVGEVSISGVEVLIGTDIGNESVGIPLQASMTFSDSQFDTSMELLDSRKIDAEDRYDEATAGNSLPYIPEFQLNLRAGLELEKFSTYLNYHYQDKVYVDGSNKSPFTGFDATIPSYGVLDWSGFFQIKEGVTAFAKVTNLADEKYAMSDLPDGYRPGAPRIWSLGMEFDF